MTQEEILQYNKRCAEFLRFKYLNQAKFWGIYPLDNNSFLRKLGWLRMDKLKFHSDWNWIMEVVEAIEKLKTETSTFEFHTQPKSVLIKEERNYCFEKGDGGRTSQPLKLNGSVWITGKTKKEAVVEAINQFLIWYEQNKTT